MSIDGTRNAVQLIADGSYNAVVESNPRFGPLAFRTLQKFVDGEPIPNSDPVASELVRRAPSDFLGTRALDKVVARCTPARCTRSSARTAQASPR